jgi:hypothetical protein
MPPPGGNAKVPSHSGSELVLANRHALTSKRFKNLKMKFSPLPRSQWAKVNSVRIRTRTLGFIAPWFDQFVTGPNQWLNPIPIVTQMDLKGGDHRIGSLEYCATWWKFNLNQSVAVHDDPLVEEEKNCDSTRRCTHIIDPSIR